MIVEVINRQEQLIRQVTEIGNGSHIFVPKEWANEKVLVVRLEKKSIKERILEMLYPHLDKIITVLLYGSYGRNEAEEDSDIDVLIIAKDRFKLENKHDIEFLVISEDSLNSAIKINPVMMYSIFREARALINKNYLEKLKKIKINPQSFKPFIHSTKESIKSNEELIELDKRTGKTASNGVIYSLILRLRGTFIIHQLLKNKTYSNGLFRKWVTSRYKGDYDELYEIYRKIRDEKEIKDKIPIKDAEILLKLLKEEIQRMGGIIADYGK